MSRSCALTLVLVSICSLWLPRAEACSCASERQPIAAYRSTPVVFIGKVTSLQTDKVYSEWFREDVTTGLAAYFSVEEPLKGITESEATVFTGGDHGGCGNEFEVGRTYLVFSWPTADDSDRNKVAETTYGGSKPSAKPIRGASVATSICSLTGELDDRQPQITMIRGLLQGTPQPLIYGRIYEYGYEFDGWYFAKDKGPMRGIKVVATRAEEQFQTQTDENGAFMFRDLRAGDYAIRLTLPDAYRALHQPDSIQVTLKNNEEAAQLNIMAQLRGALGGRLASPQGPTDQMILSLIRRTSADQTVAKIESRGTFARGNRFRFDAVPPGKYIIGISAVVAPAKNTPYPKIYYPQARTVQDAQVFELKSGEVIEDLVFTLPAPLQTFQVRGIAVTADGAPVVDADINIYDAQTPDEAVFGFTTDIKTDQAGRFTITGFKDRQYLLHARKATEFFALKGIQSRRAAVTFDASAPEVRLTLDQQGIVFRDLK